MDRYSFRTREIKGCDKSNDAIVIIPDDINVSTNRISLLSLSSSPSCDDRGSREKLSPVSVLEYEQTCGHNLATEEKMNRRGPHALPGSRSKGVRKESAQQAHIPKIETAFVSSNSSVAKLRSRRYNAVVVMEPDGCELKLQDIGSSPSQNRMKESETSYPLQMHDPKTIVLGLNADVNKKRRGLSLKSLMDSPEPKPTRPPKCFTRSMVSNLCCGQGTTTCFHKADETIIVPHQQGVQQTISVFLGSHVGSDDWCSGWQTWAYFESNQRCERPMKLKDDTRRVLRNRAFDLNARTLRINKLKEDLCPFDVTPVKQSLHAQQMTKTLSFSAAEKPCHQARLSTNTILTVREEPTRVHDSTSIWDSVQGCTDQSPAVDPPFVIRRRDLNDDDACYDSDPEETTRRRSRLDDSRRRQSTFVKQGAFDVSRSHVETPPPSIDSRSGLDKDSISRVLVQELLNERLTLIWHTSPSETKEKMNRPVGIKAWIERGQELRNALIQPKLFWQQVSLSDPRGNKRDKTKKLHSVDLLDITRILEVTKVDRRHYPLAPVKKCLIIHALDRKMMFETGSERERNRLVHTFKLTVARLGSKVILEDQSLFDEFFSFGNRVPGEAPEWARP